MPFSDPLADGVVNQLSAQRALAAGTTPERRARPSSATVRTQLADPHRPLHLLQPALRLWRRALLHAGASTPASTAFSSSTCRPRRTSPRSRHLCRISLVAPTSPAERIALIVRKASGFVYYVSREGRHRHADPALAGNSGGTIDADPQAHHPARLHRLRHFHAGAGPDRCPAGGRRRRRQRLGQPDRAACGAIPNWPPGWRPSRGRWPRRSTPKSVDRLAS